MATTYTLQVDLDTTQVALMKQSGYSLCLAKKVNNTYNVVWQGVSLVSAAATTIHMIYIISLLPQVLREKYFPMDRGLQCLWADQFFKWYSRLCCH